MQKDSPSNPTPSSSQTQKSQKVPVHEMVRTDSLDPAGRLHAYLQVKPSSHLEKSCLASVRSSIRQRRNPKETADLTSIQELVNDIDSNCHSGIRWPRFHLKKLQTLVNIATTFYRTEYFAGLLDIVRNCTYVGMADDVFALLQHNTHLYLANVVNLSVKLEVIGPYTGSGGNDAAHEKAAVRDGSDAHL